LHHIYTISHVFLLFKLCSISNTSIHILEHICLSLIHYALELSLIHVNIWLKLVIEKKFLRVVAIYLFVLNQVLSACNLLVVLRCKNGVTLVLEADRIKIFKPWPSALLAFPQVFHQQVLIQSKKTVVLLLQFIARRSLNSWLHIELKLLIVCFYNVRFWHMARLNIIFHYILNHSFPISFWLLFPAVLVMSRERFAHFVNYDIGPILFFQELSYLLRVIIHVLNHDIINCGACLPEIYWIINLGLHIIRIPKASINLVFIFIDLQIECIFLIFLLQNLLLNNLIYMLRNIVFICDSLLELYLLLNLKNTVFNFL